MNKPPGDSGYAPDWCIYFRSMAHNSTCEKDINYTKLNGDTEYRRMHKLPCFIKRDPVPNQRVHCDHFTAPTSEEIALHKQRNEDRKKLLNTVMLGIAPWREMYRGLSHVEIIECPACQGQLHLSVSRKGQVAGRCETAGCVSWKE